MLNPTLGQAQRKGRHIFIELSIVNLEAIGISEVCKSTHFGSYFECLFKIVYDEWKIFMDRPPSKNVLVEELPSHEGGGEKHIITT